MELEVVEGVAFPALSLSPVECRSPMARGSAPPLRCRAGRAPGFLSHSPIRVRMKGAHREGDSGGSVEGRESASESGRERDRDRDREQRAAAAAAWWWWWYQQK